MYDTNQKSKPHVALCGAFVNIKGKNPPLEKNKNYRREDLEETEICTGDPTETVQLIFFPKPNSTEPRAEKALAGPVHLIFVRVFGTQRNRRNFRPFFFFFSGSFSPRLRILLNFLYGNIGPYNGRMNIHRPSAFGKNSPGSTIQFGPLLILLYPPYFPDLFFLEISCISLFPPTSTSYKFVSLILLFPYPEYKMVST